MKTYDEYMENIHNKADKIRRRRRVGRSITAAVLTLVVVTAAFQPWTPDTGGQGETPVETKPNGYLVPGGTTEDATPSYGYLAELLKKIVAGNDLGSGDDIYADAGPSDSGSAGSAGTPGQTYVEVTDNQETGIIEGDLFKRSDRYLYYLKDETLCVYSVAGEASELVDKLALDKLFKEKGFTAKEMYLSADCTTLSVICNYGTYKQDKWNRYVKVFTLDVSDPKNIRLTSEESFRGYYSTSRMVNGKLLLICRCPVDVSDMDENDPQTFVPTYGSQDHMQLLPIDDIFWTTCPEGTAYTVVAQLDEKTLNVDGVKAVLGNSAAVYVSANCVYVAQSYRQTLSNDVVSYRNGTDIVGISYGAQEGLKIVGDVQIDGTVLNQYSMDEYEGRLRVFTTTLEYAQKTTTDGGISATIVSTAINCNLYCIDLSDWQIAVADIAFAPDGEQIRSARFDGTKAYACTSIRLIDPVFFFDLSDPNHIVCDDTGTINGYSTSLITFGDYLLGIGNHDWNELKVELYAQGEGKVESVAAFIEGCGYSSVYKSYYIDRENAILGIPITQQYLESYYLVLRFNGTEFEKIAKIPLADVLNLGDCRATVIDGYLYVLDSDLHVLEMP